MMSANPIHFSLSFQDRGYHTLLGRDPVQDCYVQMDSQQSKDQALVLTLSWRMSVKRPAWQDSLYTACYVQSNNSFQKELLRE